MKNKTLHFLCDSRHFLKDLKKDYKKFLIFFFSGILLLLYQQRFSIINIMVILFSSLLLPLLMLIDCNRCEKYKYIIEELFIKEDEIIIFHINKKERIEKHKIKLKSKKVISFGFFLEEEEARKIIKAIKERKINYEKVQEEIKEFQIK